jgi:hypothetical protein
MMTIYHDNRQKLPHPIITKSKHLTQLEFNSI